MKQETLIHYSKVPVVEVRSVSQTIDGENRRGGIFKPHGLWVSVQGEHDWKEWCTSEGFQDMDIMLAHEIVLSENAKILRISTPEQMDIFTKEYIHPMALCPGSRTHYIDWFRVAQEYDGIIISPYCWERSFTEHTFWYYGWDCASGCIWNASAVKEVILEVKPELLLEAGNDVSNVASV